jgi:hypothetical protein
MLDPRFCAFSELLSRMYAPEPSERFRSADELLEALGRLKI